MWDRTKLARKLETKIARSPVSLMLALTLLAGCERPFEPVAPSDIVFSIFGHLDAAQDTQWVRVMPIRESLATVPEPIDAVVTLEEIETGTTVVMSDSLIRYLPVNLGGDGLFAHNYSTAMPIVPGRHYRLTTKRSDGAEASATVLIPVWQSPTLVINHRFLAPNIPNDPAIAKPSGTIRGTRYFAMVLADGVFLPVARPAAHEGDDHGLVLATDIRPEGPRTITAVASGEPWPYDASRQLREVSTPEAVNNIEGRGLGFLAGVQTHAFPFAWCTPLERTGTCTITMSPRSATLVGVLTNGCTGEPIATPTRDGIPKAVRVRLLGPPVGGIRYDTTDASSAFQFQGLEPGVAHSLALEQLPNIEFGVLIPSMFLPLEVEDVVVGEAAVDTISIVMTRRGGCPPPDIPTDAGVQGTITNAATGAPLEGASITIGQGPGGVYAAQTDRNGFFQIGAIIPGIYTLRVSQPGFVTHEEVLPLAPRDRHIRNIQLMPVSQQRLGSAPSLRRASGSGEPESIQ